MPVQELNELWCKIMDKLKIYHVRKISSITLVKHGLIIDVHFQGVYGTIINSRALELLMGVKDGIID
jgi:hypothetical protein